MRFDLFQDKATGLFGGFLLKLFTCKYWPAFRSWSKNVSFLQKDGHKGISRQQQDEPSGQQQHIYIVLLKLSKLYSPWDWTLQIKLLHLQQNTWSSQLYLLLLSLENIVLFCHWHFPSRVILLIYVALQTEQAQTGTSANVWNETLLTAYHGSGCGIGWPSCTGWETKNRLAAMVQQHILVLSPASTVCFHISP